MCFSPAKFVPTWASLPNQRLNLAHYKVRRHGRLAIVPVTFANRGLLHDVSAAAGNKRNNPDSFSLVVSESLENIETTSSLTKPNFSQQA